MKARTKITLWTSLFTLVVAITFSVFVAFELLEQPFRLIDRELRDINDLAMQQISQNDLPSVGPQNLKQHPFDRYWIKVIDEQKRTLIETPMTEHVKIPLRVDDNFYFEKRDIAVEHIKIGKEDRDELQYITGKDVPFRVLSEIRVINRRTYTLLTAKPIPILEIEMKELIIDLLLWMSICTIFVIIASYYLSGNILKPLSKINSLIKEINDTSLSKRLPVGKNRDELYTLSHSLNNMFDRLQFSFNHQKEYIGNASHELKTPLTVLMLGSEKILQEEISGTVRSMVDRQLDTLRRLSKMVRNLLEISRLEQHESFEKDRIDLKPLALHVIEEFEDILMNKKIRLHSEMETAILSGDQGKILQMLINLLDNAIKYNLARNGEIWVSVKNVDNTVIFSISNTGSTIPKESLEKLFEQFYRVEKSRSTLFGGAGLGLTIVQQIVDLHRASIVVTSDATGVSCFTVTFPSDVS